jgi:c-di-GMP-binding flagellar brake protein YcgR
MESTPEDRRRAPRFPIEARVTVEKASGESFSAAAVNISSSGMLLRMEPPFPLELDDEVTVEIELPDDPEKAFSAWGLGKVVRMDRESSAIELSAGEFYSAESGRTEE